jgi:hypothetical protein
METATSEHQGRPKRSFKPFRKLTFAEQKVSFETLQQKMDEL